MPQTKDAKGRFMQKVLAADTLTGDTVVNRQKEDLGKIEHLMIDVETGRVAYAVLSFGGFLGMGDKLFAIPWSALAIDTGEKQFILEVDKKSLESAPALTRLIGLTWPTASGAPKSTSITAPSPTGPEISGRGALTQPREREKTNEVRHERIKRKASFTK